ncbi:unnamed protein product [Somion occarium]|uniref:Velvet domain-containing protein n=1 Tax=Somion occarium TaxID=3059160 RepID=A0ABP1E4I9_9APHY
MARRRSNDARRRRCTSRQTSVAPSPVYRVRYHRAYPQQCLLTTSPLMASHEERKPVFMETSRSRSRRRSAPRPSVRRSSRAHSPPPVEEESTEFSASPRFRPKEDKSYRLEIVQHPIKCAEFGNSTLTRLPLAPPLIVQLHIRGQATVGEIDEVELPFLVAQLSLYSADGATTMDQPEVGSGHSRSDRMLYGSLVASPQILRNYQGRQGVYFLFPDVSIRWRGQFRIGVSLLRLPGSIPEPRRDNSGNVLARAQTYPFDVVPRSEYTAPAQTPLTQYFVQQGARMTSSSLRAPAIRYS